MINEVPLYTGSAIIIIWGIAHLIPTKSIVNGFGDISPDNRKIIAMESIAEGVTLCFIGVLVVLVTVLAGKSQAAAIVYLACAVMLLVMAVLTALTGARTSILPYKICPVVKTVAAILFFLGGI